MCSACEITEARIKMLLNAADEVIETDDALQLHRQEYLDNNCDCAGTGCPRYVLVKLVEELKQIYKE